MTLAAAPMVQPSHPPSSFSMAALNHYPSPKAAVSKLATMTAQSTFYSPRQYRQ
jgi:hypothetical protein